MAAPGILNGALVLTKRSFFFKTSVSPARQPHWDLQGLQRDLPEQHLRMCVSSRPNARFGPESSWRPRKTHVFLFALFAPLQVPLPRLGTPWASPGCPQKLQGHLRNHISTVLNVVWCNLGRSVNVDSATVPSACSQPGFRNKTDGLDKKKNVPYISPNGIGPNVVEMLFRALLDNQPFGTKQTVSMKQKAIVSPMDPQTVSAPMWSRCCSERL